MEISKIFKNEEILYPEYLPPLLPHREEQIKQIARNCYPAAEGRRPQNTFIYGPPGVGKTACVKFIFREMDEKFGNVKNIYINCWDLNTPSAVLSKIIIELGWPIPRRGLAKDEMLGKLIELVKKSDKGVIICLDEVDQLIFKNQEILYDFLRINQYLKNPFGIIFISNNPYIFSKVDPRIKSSLNIEEIEFKPYSLQEMKDILNERVKEAFHTGVITPGVLILIANHAIKNGGDVRIGLECFLKAGRLAEQERAKKIEVEHVKKVLHEVKAIKPKIIKEKINDTEKIILEILDREKKLSFGKLYEEYSKKVSKALTERAFREHLLHLSDVKMVKIKKKGKYTVICKIKY